MPSVDTIVTPGETVDLVVTDRGTAVNPRRQDLKDALIQGGIPVVDIEELAAMAEADHGQDPTPWSTRTGWWALSNTGMAR